MLRLRICVEGEPVQRILTSTAAVLDVVDGRAWDEATLRRRIADAANVPFDLAQGPLFRTTMFEADDGRSVVAACPSSSRRLRIYRHRDPRLGSALCCRGDLRRAGLPPAPDPFAAFAERRAAVERKDREVMSAYWRDRLLGVEPLELPVDRPRHARPSYRGGSVAVPIGAELSQSLNEFARSNGTSLTLCSWRPSRHFCFESPGSKILSSARLEAGALLRRKTRSATSSTCCRCAAMSMENSL